MKILTALPKLTALLCLLAPAVPAASRSPKPLDITQAPYTARGDGSTDCTETVNRALADAARLHRDVYAPPGVFVHSGVLHNPGVALRGSGAATVFQATNPVHGAVELTGTGARLERCTLTSPKAEQRLSNPDSAAVRVNGAKRFVVSGVTIGQKGTTGAASAGIICADGAADGGQITNNTVTNTLADGIHLTAGAHGVTVSGNTVVNVGDDMIAVVSYLKDDGRVHDIVITKNHGVSQTHGRGISVVGGDRVTIDRNTLDGSDAAGIYLAAEDSYNTYGPSDVSVTNNTLNHANQNHDIPHGGIFVFGRTTASADGKPIVYPAENIVIAGNTLSDTFYMGIRIGGYARGVRVENNIIRGTTYEGIAVSDTGETGADAGARDVSIVGNAIGQTGTGAIKVFSGAQGTLTIKNNRLTDINTSNNSGADAIYIDAGATGLRALILRGNRYANPGGYAVRDFIHCAVSAASVGTSAAAIRVGNVMTTTPAKPIVVTP